MLASWIVSALLIIFAVFIRLRVKHFKDTPRGVQNFTEATLDMLHGFMRNMMGEGYEYLAGIFWGLFAYIIFANYISLFKLRSPTAELACTMALAVFSLVLMHGIGIKSLKGKYFKEYIRPNAIFLPINIIGEISKPISLCFRLFGNVLGGVIIMGMAYNLLPTILTIIVPDAFHAYFDIFAGGLQAFIFTAMTMTFVQQKSVVS